LVGLIQPGSARYLAHPRAVWAVTATLRATTPFFSSLIAIACFASSSRQPAAVATVIVSGFLLITAISRCPN